MSVINIAKTLLSISVIIISAGCVVLVSKKPAEVRGGNFTLKSDDQYRIVSFVRDETADKNVALIRYDSVFDGAVKYELSKEFPSTNLKTSGLANSAEIRDFDRPEHRWEIFALSSGPAAKIKTIAFYNYRRNGLSGGKALGIGLWTIVSGATLGFIPLYLHDEIAVGGIAWDQNGSEIYNKIAEGGLSRWFWTPLIFAPKAQMNFIGVHNSMVNDTYSGLVSQLAADMVAKKIIQTN